MKKILFLAIALMMSVCGAWSQDWTNQGTLRISPALTAGGDFSNGTVFYTIKGKANNGYLRSDVLSNGHLSARGTAPSGNEGRWAVIGSDETGYQVINKATKQAIAMSKDFSHTTKPNDTPYANASSLTLDYTDANTFFDITTHKTTSGYWVLSAHNDNAYFWNDLTTLGYWYSEAGYGWVGWGGNGQGDNGASFQFTMVEEFVLNTFTFVLPEGVTVTYAENTYNNNETVDVTGAVAAAEVTVNEEAPAGYEYVVTVDAVNKTVTVTLQLKKVKTLADLNPNKLYTISSQSRGSFVYASSYSATNLSGSKRANYNSGNLDATDANFQFAFVQEGDKYYLWSKGANKFAAYANPNVTLSETLPAAGLTFKASTGGTKENYPVVLAIDGSHEINMSTDQHQGLLTTWNDTGDAGNMLNIVPVADLSSEDLAKIDALIHPTNRVDVTYHYILGTVTKDVVVEQTIGETAAAPAAIPFATLDYGELPTVAAEGNTINVTVTETLPFVKTTDPTDPKYGVIRIHSNENRYAYVSEDGKAKCKTTYLTGEDEGYLFYIMGNVLDGFQLMSQYGAIEPTANQASLGISGAKWELRAGTAGSKFSQNVFTLYNESVTYFNSRPEGNILYWTAGDEGSTMQLIQNVEVTLSEVGFGTFYYQYPVAVPSGVKAYTLAEDGSYLTATQVTTIPVGVGVILEGTGEHNFPVAQAAATTSCLDGTYAEKDTPEGAYVLSVVDTNVGFYKFDGDKVAANKAYYVPSTPSETQGFVVNFGGLTTGINNVNANVNANHSFDLQGRRVSKATRGLFIQNGVKVIR